MIARKLNSVGRIVVITSIVVAATAAAISDKFDRYSRIGAIIGTSVSAAFLILLGLMNMYILYKLVQHLRKLVATAPGEEEHPTIQGGGFLFHLLKRMFKLINRYDRKHAVSFPANPEIDRGRCIPWASCLGWDSTLPPKLLCSALHLSKAPKGPASG